MTAAFLDRISQADQTNTQMESATSCAGIDQFLPISLTEIRSTRLTYNIRSERVSAMPLGRCGCLVRTQTKCDQMISEALVYVPGCRLIPSDATGYYQLVPGLDDCSDEC